MLNEKYAVFSTVNLLDIESTSNGTSFFVQGNYYLVELNALSALYEGKTGP